jgi:hypothetical protein
MLDSIATPCSVKALGNLRIPPQLDVPIWNIKVSNSSFVSWNINSPGNLTMNVFGNFFICGCATQLIKRSSAAMGRKPKTRILVDEYPKRLDNIMAFSGLFSALWLGESLQRKNPC